MVKFKKKFAKDKILWLMLVPAIIYFIIFAYLPMCGIWLAFTRFDFNLGFLRSPFIRLIRYRPKNCIKRRLNWLTFMGMKP